MSARSSALIRARAANDAGGENSRSSSRMDFKSRRVVFIGYGLAFGSGIERANLPKACAGRWLRRRKSANLGEIPGRPEIAGSQCDRVLRFPVLGGAEPPRSRARLCQPGPGS